MEIILTGASSFTGFWFAKALCNNKHQVTLLLRRSEEEYRGIRKMRVDILKEYAANILYDCPFGSERFSQYLRARKPFDLFCHHAAEVADYKSPDFDFGAALISNTKGIKQLFEILRLKECTKFLLTGSVFEQREGFGSDGIPAVSPYGLSKGLTSDVFCYFARLFGLRLGKFIVPNPFGPYEDKGFTTYLAKCWLHGEKPEVSFPDYVRDNIPVDLLADSYSRFAEKLTSERDFVKYSPSYNPEPQRYFVQKFSDEMQQRFNKPCEYTLLHQTEFPEPKVRINCDMLTPDYSKNRDEPKFWNSLSDFYMKTLL